MNCVYVRDSKTVNHPRGCLRIPCLPLLLFQCKWVKGRGREGWNHGEGSPKTRKRRQSMRCQDRIPKTIMAETRHGDVRIPASIEDPHRFSDPTNWRRKPKSQEGTDTLVKRRNLRVTNFMDLTKRRTNYTGTVLNFGTHQWNKVTTKPLFSE